MTIDDRNSRRGPGRIWAGLFLLLVGGVLLLDQLGFPLPDWLFSWHILLIALGFFIGLRHGFRGAGWLIMIGIGSVYLVQDYYPDIRIHRFIWPGALILVGLLIILRPGRHRWNGDPTQWRAELDRRNRWGRHYRRGGWGRDAWGGGYNPNDPGSNATDPAYGTNDPANGATGTTTGTTGTTGSSSTTFSSSNESYSSDDYIDTTSIFGGVHKKIVSKNFKGGDITTMLGGTELDLTQADFNGTARLDVTQIMGGTKIIVPPHWEVRSEVTAVFAGFEDKRQQPAMTNPDKVLIIDGTSIFGGIELKNY